MDKRGETARERKVLEGEREGATGRGWGRQRSEQGRRVRWLWTALPFTCPGDPHGYINRSPRSERYLLSMSPSYVGESTPPSSEETRDDASAWRTLLAIGGWFLVAAAGMLRAGREEVGTEMDASSVRGSLSSSEAS